MSIELISGINSFESNIVRKNLFRMCLFFSRLDLNDLRENSDADIVAKVTLETCAPLGTVGIACVLVIIPELEMLGFFGGELYGIFGISLDISCRKVIIFVDYSGKKHAKNDAFGCVRKHSCQNGKTVLLCVCNARALCTPLSSRFSPAFALHSVSILDS